MKVSDQLKTVLSHFEVSNHRFLNMIAAGVQNKLQQNIPDMQLKISGKSQDGTIIKLRITGTKITKDADDFDRVSNNVRHTIDGLKNPSDLLSILDY